MSAFRILEADLADPRHGAALLALLDEYARDPMGGGAPLTDYTRDNIVSALRARANARVLLAFDGDTPAALAICFEGFSTFACKPLLNIHDIVVSAAFRGQGLATLMLARAEEIARAAGCCKLTLEVLEGNTVAQAAYQAAGYAGYQLDPRMGRALFWQKKLD